jgi:outer membrane protein OmpA-like peptidoglycan-associated protein
MGETYSQNEVKIKFINEANVNSDEFDFCPVFYKEGIVFISSIKTPNSKFDKTLGKWSVSFFNSERMQDGKLGLPKPYAEKLLTPYNDGPIVFNRTTDTVFFCRNNLKGSNPILGKDGFMHIGIYYAVLKNNKWSKITPMPFNNPDIDILHPAVSPDGNKIYFAANMPNGFGGLDIYFSYKSDGQWVDPINMGPEVNSANDESFPFIHQDGSLFFSSNRAGTRGGLDIFRSNFENGNWSKPQNLSGEINSKKDDFGFILDSEKKNGYLSSNRDGGKGNDDIYGFSLQGGNLDDFLEERNNVSNLELIVSSRTTGDKIANANIRAINLQGLYGAEVVGVTDSNDVIILHHSEEDSLPDLRISPLKVGIKNTDNAGIAGFKIKQDKDHLFTITAPGFNVKQVLLLGNTKVSPVNVLLDPESANQIAVNLKTVGGLLGNALPGATISLTNTSDSTTTEYIADERGMINANLNKDQKYNVSIKYKGQVFHQSILDSKDINSENGELTINVGQLVSLKEGVVINLPNIYYNYNDYKYRPDAIPTLNSVLELMKNNSGLYIELASHTDSRGSSNTNKVLSQNRANYVIEYLIKNGIDAKRLVAKGYGENKLKNKCSDGVNCPDNLHQQNRRTEIVVLKNMDSDSYWAIPNTENNASTVSSSNVLSSGPEYWVVAGVFRSKINANSLAEKIIKAGYNQCKIMPHPAANTSQVVVGRFPTREEAIKLVQELSKNQIESFVKAVNN